MPALLRHALVIAVTAASAASLIEVRPARAAARAPVHRDATDRDAADRDAADRDAADRDSVRTTMDGVYTLAQATRGKDLFAMRCQSCHTPSQHSGPPFRNKWFGKSLGDLYSYIRREMPKNEPRSLTDQEYTLALAFLLRMNGMPTGAVPLAADSAALQSIRLDSVRAVP